MKKRTLWILIVLPVLAAGGFLLWASTASPAMAEAHSALQSHEWVQVETAPWISFLPQDTSPQTGLILYPGGRVEPAAYAPAAAAIAASGYLVVIVPMPLNLAVLQPEEAGEVIAAHPEIRNWTVGGHSLGGAMAARFAAQHPDRVGGLVLWAAYPSRSDDLSAADLAVTSIYATRDGVADPARIRESGALLPEGTQWVEIEGGNHAQFGWYGDQSGDLPAAITRSDQQRQVIQATLDLLSRISSGVP